MSTMSITSAMENLPDEILKYNITQFLPPVDICQLSNTSNKFHARLALYAAPPRKILSEFSRADYHHLNADHGPYPIEYGFEIPVPSQVECHSICVSMSWSDQGWGNQKSHLVVIAGNKDTRGKQGAVVFASCIAPHSPECLEITFRPNRCHSYHLWYVVGGGGGHSLHLKNVTVQALIFDDSSRSYLKACNFLAQRKYFVPWDNASPLEHNLSGSNLLLDKKKQIPALLSEYVSEADLTEKLMNLMLMDSILTNFADELNLYGKCLSDYENLHHQQWGDEFPMPLAVPLDWDDELGLVLDGGHWLQDEGTLPSRRRRRNVFRRFRSWGQSLTRRQPRDIAGYH
mmetsp:Transcript_12576/g.20488  ORF Transcript_12576/g.20488 Transcript_12576/m.20488 type:complete len:344 (+) Transcript_12576:61-1092(+)